MEKIEPKSYALEDVVKATGLSKKTIFGMAINEQIDLCVLLGGSEAIYFIEPNFERPWNVKKIYPEDEKGLKGFYRFENDYVNAEFYVSEWFTLETNKAKRGTKAAAKGLFKINKESIYDALSEKNINHIEISPYKSPLLFYLKLDSLNDNLSNRLSISCEDYKKLIKKNESSLLTDLPFDNKKISDNPRSYRSCCMIADAVNLMRNIPNYEDRGIVQKIIRIGQQNYGDNFPKEDTVRKYVSEMRWVLQNKKPN